MRRVIASRWRQWTCRQEVGGKGGDELGELHWHIYTTLCEIDSGGKLPESRELSSGVLWGMARGQDAGDGRKVGGRVVQEGGYAYL